MIEIQIRRPCRKHGERVVGIALHCTECGAHTYSDYPERIDHKLITEWVLLTEALKALAEIGAIDK